MALLLLIECFLHGWWGSGAIRWTDKVGKCPKVVAILAPDPLENCKRVEKEAGLTTNRWTMIQQTHLSNSVSDEEGFIFWQKI